MRREKEFKFRFQPFDDNINFLNKVFRDNQQDDGYDPQTLRLRKVWL